MILHIVLEFLDFVDQDRGSYRKVYIRISVTLCSNYEGLTLHVEETVESITNDHPSTAQNMVSAVCAI